MKQLLDKLNSKISTNKKLLIFFVVLGIIGIISGSFFSIIIKSEDKTLVTEYLNNFFNNIKNINYINTFLNSEISNIIFILIIWILGFSGFGIPIILFMYFSKFFSFGFSVASLIINYQFKGIIYSVIYVLPHLFIFIAYTILMIYSLSLSLKIILAIFKKKSIDFKYIINRYLFILLVAFITINIGITIETFLMPNLIKLIV